MQISLFWAKKHLNHSSAEEQGVRDFEKEKSHVKKPRMTLIFQRRVAAVVDPLLCFVCQELRTQLEVPPNV